MAKLVMIALACALGVASARQLAATQTRVAIGEIGKG